METLFPGELKLQGGRVWSWDGSRWVDVGEVRWDE